MICLTPQKAITGYEVVNFLYHCLGVYFKPYRLFYSLPFSLFPKFETLVADACKFLPLNHHEKMPYLCPSVVSANLLLPLTQALF